MMFLKIMTRKIILNEFLQIIIFSEMMIQKRQEIVFILFCSVLMIYQPESSTAFLMIYYANDVGSCPPQNDDEI